MARERDRRLRRGGRRGRRPKVCQFCSGELEITDYHDDRMLRRFISDTAKILPRRRTGVCAKHQRRLAMTVKRARMLAIIPITEMLVRK
ncbi:MAG: 30S ribosomal protein S18 [Truepera sp.]|nr:30S ribosomal protein S18 [Truepera sp.]MDE0529386.1 30S ribosomal protein S18 [Truepera sp.]